MFYGLVKLEFKINMQVVSYFSRFLMFLLDLLNVSEEEDSYLYIRGLVFQ